jgi:hypothetical protein
MACCAAVPAAGLDTDFVLLDQRRHTETNGSLKHTKTLEK